MSSLLLTLDKAYQLLTALGLSMLYVMLHREGQYRRPTPPLTTPSTHFPPPH